MHELAKTVPENVFLMYQATFAIITPAIIAGAFAERMKFSAMMWFMALWLLFVYVPVAHWVWGGGFLGRRGRARFRRRPGGPSQCRHRRPGLLPGASASARATATNTWRRTTWCSPWSAPRCCGSAGSASMPARRCRSGELAGSAMLNTHISAAVAALVWMSIEWASRGKPSVLGILSGAVAGLGTITPAAGYVEPWAAHGDRRWPPARSATGPRSC